MKKGFVFDPNKLELNEFEPNSTFLLGNERKNKRSKDLNFFYKGQFLTEKQVKKLGLSKHDIEKYLVPVEVEKGSIVKQKVYGNKLSFINVFGPKPKIIGNYKPNRTNANNYRKKSR